jgi:hypothetical protein
MGWHHQKKKAFSMVKDAVWHEMSKEHTGIPLVPLAVTCEKLNFLPRKMHSRSLSLTWPLHTNHEAAL